MQAEREGAWCAPEPPERGLSRTRRSRKKAAEVALAEQVGRDCSAMKMEGGEAHFGREQKPTGYERGGKEVQWVSEAEGARAGCERLS